MVRRLFCRFAPRRIYLGRRCPARAESRQTKNGSSIAHCTVTPRGEPEPALKYRLLPLASELKEGNAVPIYLRLIHEQNDQARKYWTETPQTWNELPLDKVPLPRRRNFWTASMGDSSNSSTSPPGGSRPSGITRSNSPIRLG